LLKIGNIAQTSIAVGTLVGNLRKDYRPHDRWQSEP
jgi:hypothetical protein